MINKRLARTLEALMQFLSVPGIRRSYEARHVAHIRC